MPLACCALTAVGSNKLPSTTRLIPHTVRCFNIAASLMVQ